MKNMLFRLMLIVAMTAILATSVLAQQLTAVTFVTVQEDNVNVRSQPSITSAVIARVRDGQVYPVLGQSTYGNWYLIDLGGGFQGWIFAPLVEIDTINAVTGAPTTDFSLGAGGGAVPVQGGTVVVVPGIPLTTGQTFVIPNPGDFSLGAGGGAVPQQQQFVFPNPGQVPGFIVTTGFSADYINSTVGFLGNVNIRQAPTTQSRILGRTAFDQRAVPIGRNVFATWYLVDYNGLVGWVSAEFVAVPPSINVVALPVVG